MTGASHHEPRRLMGDERVPWWRSWRAALAVTLVAAQAVVVLLTHVSPSCCASRYFAWAPNDYAVEYSIVATVNGRVLGKQAVRARYRLPSEGFWEDPPQRLERLLRRRDQLYSPGQRIHLTVRYRLDGHPPVTWTWDQA